MHLSLQSKQTFEAAWRHRLVSDGRYRSIAGIHLLHGNSQVRDHLPHESLCLRDFYYLFVGGTLADV